MDIHTVRLPCAFLPPSFHPHSHLCSHFRLLSVSWGMLISSPHHLFPSLNAWPQPTSVLYLTTHMSREIEVSSAFLKANYLGKNPYCFVSFGIHFWEIGVDLEIVPVTRSQADTRDKGSAAWALETPCRITTLEEKQLPKKKRKGIVVWCQIKKQITTLSGKENSGLWRWVEVSFNSIRLLPECRTLNFSHSLKWDTE